MFSGIISDLGKVECIDRQNEGAELMVCVLLYARVPTKHLPLI